MAFGGTPVITQISDRVVRITGATLSAGVSGTIGLFGNSGTPDLVLPASFNPQPYGYDGHTVTLQDSLDVTGVAITSPIVAAVTVTIAKTGTTHADWLATITNAFDSDLVVIPIEIYINFH